MHSCLVRSFTVTGYAQAVLTFACLSLIFSTTFHDLSASSVKHLHIGGHVSKLSYRPVPSWYLVEALEDVALINLSATADFSKVFNWNVKQLFIYIKLEYVTEENTLNQDIIWSDVVTRKDKPYLMLQKMVSLIFLKDGENQLRGKNATIILRWNVIPNVGILQEYEFRGPTLHFPIEYA